MAQLILIRHLLRLVLNHGASARLSGLVPVLVALAAVTTVGALASGLSGERQRLMVELVRRLAMQRILAVTTTVPLSEFETSTFSDDLSRARQQALVRPSQIVTGVLGAAQALLTSVGLVVALAAIAPVMVPVLALAVAPSLVLLRRNSRDLHGVDRGLATADRQRWYLEDVLSTQAGAKETRTFRLPGFLGPLQSELATRRVEAYRVLIRRRSWRLATGSVAGSLVLVGGLGLLARLVLDGDLSAASATTAALITAQLAASLRSAGAGVGQVYENSLFLQEVAAFTAMVPAEPVRPVGALMPMPRSLRVEHLTFCYPNTDRPVLSDVSMEFGAGQLVAIVGENGSGKTTLTKILCGLYAAPPGTVLWDGEDASGVDPSRWRSRFGVAFQDFMKYELSARLNIAVGRHEEQHDAAAVRRAALLADADGFLSGLSEGYDTVLSRAYAGGADLSIGQWQRVALARVFFSDAPVLILDEPTAALDPRVEQELLGRVRDLAGRKTVVLISHRLSSVRFADKILFLRHGRLVEEGTHDQLMSEEGHYAELFTLQAAAYRLLDSE